MKLYSLLLSRTYTPLWQSNDRKKKEEEEEEEEEKGHPKAGSPLIHHSQVKQHNCHSLHYVKVESA